MEKFILVVFATIGVIAVVAVLTALPVMWLWNWLMPLIFGLMKLNFWQALGIALLSTLLFKSSSYKSK